MGEPINTLHELRLLQMSVQAMKTHLNTQLDAISANIVRLIPNDDPKDLKARNEAADKRLKKIMNDVKRQTRGRR